MSLEQRRWLKNQDQLLKPGFLGMPKTDNVFHQGYQDVLLALADQWPAFLIPTHDQQLLAQDEHLDCLGAPPTFYSSEGHPKAT